MIQLVLCFVSLYQNQGVGRAVFLSGDFVFFFFFFLCVCVCVCVCFTLFYNTALVLPYIDMNPPRVYMRSQTVMICKVILVVTFIC